MPARLAFVCVLVSCAPLLAGCATAPAEPRRAVRVETTDPGRIRGAGRDVSVSVRQGATILKIGGAAVRCEDYEGWLGNLGGERGWIQVGALTISWVPESITVRSRRNWRTIPLSDDVNVYFYQDGRNGRNVFRE